MVDFITPETETSIWYFWGMARNFNPHDEALTATIREASTEFSAKTSTCSEQQQKKHCWPILRAQLA